MHVDHAVLQHLEAADRLAELLALLAVFDGVGQHLSHAADRLGADRGGAFVAGRVRATATPGPPRRAARPRAAAVRRAPGRPPGGRRWCGSRASRFPLRAESVSTREQRESARRARGDQQMRREWRARSRRSSTRAAPTRRRHDRRSSTRPATAHRIQARPRPARRSRYRRRPSPAVRSPRSRPPAAAGHRPPRPCRRTARPTSA